MPIHRPGVFPGFYFFGRKKILARFYPKPMYNSIVEPFCGAAAYSCTYPSCKVHLFDKDERIVATWKFLISASKKDILSLPILQAGESLTDERFKNLPPGARYFIGYNLGRDSKPRSKPSPYSTWSPYYRQLIADNIHLIRHWKVSHGSYENAKNVNATWFVDPPYIGEAGKRYRESNSNINYTQLARWVRERKGLRIVCEDTTARWLPFRPLRQPPYSLRTKSDAVMESVYVSHNAATNKQQTVQAPQRSKRS
jgi:hypothetical protein